MKSTLKKIIQYKIEELESLKRKVSLQDVRKMAESASPPWPFLKGFEEDQINIIAEVKRASPSAGMIRPNFDPLEIASIYERGGARALSVLTDENFFKGSLNFLRQIKQRASIPCLRKDFTLDEYHIFEARGAGADALLLIAAVLDKIQLKDFYHLTQELGMTALVEVHDNDDLEKALALEAELIGINNRNLHTFKTTIETSLNLRQRIPDGIKLISESGLNTHQDLVDLMIVGFDGFLIGEALMREKDIGRKLREFISGSEA